MFILSSIKTSTNFSNEKFITIIYYFICAINIKIDRRLVCIFLNFIIYKLNYFKCFFYIFNILLFKILPNSPDKK